MFLSQRHEVRQVLDPWKSKVSRGVTVYINLANQLLKHFARSHRSLWGLTGKLRMDTSGLLEICCLQFLPLLLKQRKERRVGEEGRKGWKEGGEEK